MGLLRTPNTCYTAATSAAEPGSVGMSLSRHVPPVYRNMPPDSTASGRRPRIAGCIQRRVVLGGMSGHRADMFFLW